MKKHILKIASAYFIALICATGAMAQDSNSRGAAILPPPLFSGTTGFRTWSIGLNAGVLAPFSAAGGRNDFSKWVPTLGYGAYVKYQASHAIGFQLDVTRGTLKANNDKLWVGVPPNSPFSSFTTDINWAASFSGVVTLGNINWSQLHTSIQPYFSIGGGAINFQPTTISNTGTSVRFNPSGSNTEFYVPIGFGIKANLTQGINLDLGYTMAYVVRSIIPSHGTSFHDISVSNPESLLRVGIENRPSTPTINRYLFTTIVRLLYKHVFSFAKDG